MNTGDNILPCLQYHNPCIVIYIYIHIYSNFEGFVISKWCIQFIGLICGQLAITVKAMFIILKPFSEPLCSELIVYPLHYSHCGQEDFLIWICHSFPLPLWCHSIPQTSSISGVTTKWCHHRSSWVLLALQYCLPPQLFWEVPQGLSPPITVCDRSETGIHLGILVLRYGFQGWDQWERRSQNWSPALL